MCSGLNATCDSFYSSQGRHTACFDDRNERVLEELLRIGRHAVVSFPNFAHWRVRFSLLTQGRMPVTRLIPVSWYETPNIHHLTVADFRALVRARGIRVEMDHPVAGKLSTVASPMRFSATPVEYKVPPPLVGEHTDEILRGLLGKSDADIAALRAAGIL